MDRPRCRPVAACVARWIGDAVHGVFAALGAPQITILTIVIGIDAAGIARTGHAEPAAMVQRHDRAVEKRGVADAV